MAVFSLLEVGIPSRNKIYTIYLCYVLEHNTFSISTTEATTSSETTENSVTVIITISSSVVGVVIVVFCIIIFIRRILPKTSGYYL